jgi:O-antigen ligase
MQAAVASDTVPLTRAAPHVESAEAPAVIRRLTFFMIAISGFVQFEPAPTDAVFMALAGVLAVYGPTTLRFRGIGFTIMLGLVVLVIGNLVSLMPAIYALKAFQYVLVSVYLLALFLVVAGLIGRYGPSFAHLCLRAFCVAAFLVSIIGILARFRLVPNPEAYFRDDSGLRVRSTFKDPNVFAPFVVAAILVVLNDVVTRRRRLLSGVVMSTVYLIAVIFAFSRGAFVNMAVALAIYTGACLCIIRDSAVTRRLVLTLGLGAVIAILGVIYLLTLDDLGSFLDERLAMQSYDTGRFAMQRLTLDVSLDWPLGVGPGEWPVRYDFDPHNVYLRILAENGFIGILGFLIWVMGCMSKGLRGLWERSPEATTYAACCAVSAGTLFESVVIDTFHWRHVFLFLAIPIGLRIHDLWRSTQQTGKVAA